MRISWIKVKTSGLITEPSSFPHLIDFSRIQSFSSPIILVFSGENERSQSEYAIAGAEEVDVHAEARVARPVEADAGHIRSLGMGAVRHSRTRQRMVRHR